MTTYSILKNIYKMTDSFYGSICTLAILIFLFSITVHFLIFFLLFSSKLSVSFEFFRIHTILADFTSGPSGPVGRLGVRPCSRSWAGLSAPVLAGLLSAGCLVSRAAGLAGACCRADWLAAGRTARAGAAPAWAAAAARAAQVWPP